MASEESERINLPQEEEKILQYWKEIDAFKTSLNQSKNRPRYTFYDGPPFATGLPHYGHILAGTVKDIVTRWAHQSGYHVERRFGWDCHGLPVEYEIDKALGIRGPEDVAKMGIAKYNAECRKIVSRYAGEWEAIVTRLGRWIDFQHDYKTMYPWFMESIWWVFKQLFDKGLIYKGFKVMPFSTACSTPLSNFEAGQNYKEVDDPAVTVSFPLEDEPGTSVLAWTTTPWTLPSNLALCVHPDFTYLKVRVLEEGAVYIILESRVNALWKEGEYEILEKLKGSTLEGRSYKPLFNYFLYMKERGAFRVVLDTYVTEEGGTGIVHQAPYFGEDDYRVCMRYGIIHRDMEPVCPVDASGCFMSNVTDFAGVYVKTADKDIIRHLQAAGRLVRSERSKHNYPFCWRSDTPLLYRAVPSWFVRVEHMQEALLNNNQQCYWVPNFVKEGRFGNWLRDARDWNISRSRYWGTPIPLWISDDGEEVVCIGSIEELKRASGVELTDLHREYVDKVEIPSRRGKGTLKRVTEVFDCWFESGSMPYAQKHYPFENQREFEDGFPADFIAEGIDQTRGWFYTLLVLSTALFGKPPFKNLICHGLVLAADGQKMSKRKKNYPDPIDVVNEYGADAVRLYLINSPVVRADNLRFKEPGVRGIVKDVFFPWYNAFNFFMQNVDRLEREEGIKFMFDENKESSAVNYMDRWILSFMQSLIQFVREEMEAYRLYTVVPRLVKVVDQLTKWYVRMNRKRLRGDGGVKDCVCALETLCHVLLTMTKVMAPFIPFLTEYFYQNMKKLLVMAQQGDAEQESVHFLMLPQPREALIDRQMEEAVARMQNVIDLARVLRDRNTLPIKYPLKEVVVLHKESVYLDDISSLESYIKEDLNVRKVTVSSDKKKFKVHQRVELDFKAVGSKLKSDLKKVGEELSRFTDEQISRFQQEGSVTVCGHELSLDEVFLKYAFGDNAGKKGKANKTSDTEVKYDAHSDGEVLILLDITPDQSMLDEGRAREVINRIQRLRKEGKLQPQDEITIYYETSPTLSQLVQKYSDYIFATIKRPLVHGPPPSSAEVIVHGKATVKPDDFHMTIVRGQAATSANAAAAATSPSSGGGSSPACRFVNVELCGQRAAGGSSSVGTVLLENPRGEYIISADQLLHQVQVIFGLQNRAVRLYRSRDQKNELTASNLSNVLSLHASTLYAFTS